MSAGEQLIAPSTRACQGQTEQCDDQTRGRTGDNGQRGENQQIALAMICVCR